jgi:hypothetical protein
MQAEYATAWLSGEAAPLDELDEELPELDEELPELDEELPELDEELPELDEEPPDAADEPFDVVLDPRCATVGVLAPPPQPAASSARAVSAASPAISRIAFISSSPRAGWMLRARGVVRNGRLHHGDRRCNRAVTADAPRWVVHEGAAGRGSR